MPARVLGLDVGDRHVGLAASDELGLTAQGLPTLERRHKHTDMVALQEIITMYAITRIVVGMPCNMDGSYGERAAITERFVPAIEAAYKLPCIPWDERLTTRQAEWLLIAANQRRSKRKAVRDKLRRS